MSAATPVKGQTAPSVEIKTKTALPPVAVFDTPLAKAITVGRPVLLLAACYARLSALIKDPVSTLQTALPVVVLIQVLYAVLCLPAAGSQNAKPAKKARPGEKKKHEATGPNLAVVSPLLQVNAAVASIR
jgi:phosphatidylinositol glycan class F